MQWDMDTSLTNETGMGFYSPGESTPYYEPTTQEQFELIQDKTIATKYGIDIPGGGGGKRTLSSEEYAYYYSFLNRDTITKPVKAAIAVVLKADLMLLYKSNFNHYRDPVVDKWVDVYKTLSGAELAKAMGEIKDFDITLFQAIPLGAEYSELAKRSRATFIGDLMFEENLKRQEVIVKQYLIKERLVIFQGKQEKEFTRQSKVIEKLYNDYMKKQARSYIGAIFMDHPVSVIMTKNLSDLEFPLRQKILKAIDNGTLATTQALYGYRKALDLLLTDPTKNSFETKTNKILGFYKHPFLRFRTK